VNARNPDASELWSPSTTVEGER